MPYTAISVDFEEISVSENLKNYLYYQDNYFSIERVSYKLLEIMEEQGCLSTWFVVGRIAKNYKSLIRKISELGHEVASHSMTHALFNRIQRSKIRDEIVDSKHVIEDIVGKKVHGFRTPNFSVTNETLDLLIENGYLYDSSLVFNHISKRVGTVDVEEKNGAYHYNGLPVIPIGKLELFGRTFPLGGGFARLFPVYFLKNSIKKETAFANAFYCHPWEFDMEIPFMGSFYDVNLIRTFIGRNSFFEKFRAACACSSKQTLVSTVAALQEAAAE